MTAAGPHGIAYRPEIDGLRAIAVIAVILYHGDFGWLPSGLLGVDMFFVISGYLITGILHAELRDGSFSVARFYERRIRRIIPALMLVMLLCIPPAVLLMLPDDLENFGQSLVATALFVNNVLLLITTDYFGIDAQFKPLMHTWSLGIEEQYYVLVPLFLWFAWRLGKARGLLIGIAAVTVLSFVACLWLARIAQRHDFFLIVSRGWELGAGSLAVLLEPRIRAMVKWPWVGAALALAGLTAAVAMLFVTLPLTPGWRTAIPVGGICLVLLFGGASDPVGRLLSAPPLVGIGLISYSAYLIHQPVFAFTRIASLEAPCQWLLAALLIPILALAWASWRFVERPFRDRNRIGTRTALLGSGAATLAVIAVGLAFHFTSGFYRNWPELAAPEKAGRNANIAYNMGPDRFLDLPLPASGERTRLLVIGNSFARDFINMTLETLRYRPPAISFTSVSECRPLPHEAIENARRADFIVLAGRAPAPMTRCIVGRVRQLRAIASARVIVIGRKSFGYNNNAVMLLPQEVRWTYRADPLAEAVAANEAAKRALPPDVYVDTLGMIGDREGKVPVFTPDRMLISQDRVHLTQPGARYIGGILFRHEALAALASHDRAGRRERAFSSPP